MKSDALRRLESVASKDGEHLGQLVTKFFNDYRELSLNPETSALRAIVASSAEALGHGFHQMNDTKG